MIDRRGFFAIVAGAAAGAAGVASGKPPVTTGLDLAVGPDRTVLVLSGPHIYDFSGWKKHVVRGAWHFPKDIEGVTATQLRVDVERVDTYEPSLSAPPTHPELEPFPPLARRYLRP